MRYRDFVDLTKDCPGSGSNALGKVLHGYDGAVVATATQVRLELIRQLSREGLPLYIEKPLAYRSADVENLLKATCGIASRSMLGFMMRYHPAVQFLSDKSFSDLFSLSLEVGHDVREWRPGRRFEESYGSLPDGGGVLLDLCHELDILHCLVPGAEISSVSSIGHERFPGVDFCTKILLTGGKSVIGVVSLDYIAPEMHRSITLRGTQVSYEFDLVRQRYAQIAQGGQTALALDCERNALFLQAMEDFLRLLSGRPVCLRKNFPRLDQVAESCRLIATAWEGREFIGNLRGEFN